MKSIMLTIKLKYFYLTYKGIKTIEVRKSCPKDFVGDVYETVSKTNFEKDLMEIPENEREFFRQFKGKVGLKFTLNKVESCPCIDHLNPNKAEQTCVDWIELGKYTNNKRFYLWYISNLVIFDKPKELSEFYHYCKDIKCEYRKNHCSICHREPLTKAQQNWCYIESEN